MKRSRSLLSVFILFAAAPVAAQDKPFSMVGTWLAKGQSVSIGDSIHPEHTNRDAEPKVHPLTLRMVFEKHEGSNFWGTSTGPSGSSERIVGALARDGKSGIAINARGGVQQMTVLDRSTIEVCYAIKGPAYLAATCTVWTRQP